MQTSKGPSKQPVIPKRYPPPTTASPVKYADLKDATPSYIFPSIKNEGAIPKQNKNKAENGRSCTSRGYE